MQGFNQSKPGRVGVYLQIDTRNRLNKVKADLSYARGEIVHLDELVNMLLDHFAETSPQASARRLEVA